MVLENGIVVLIDCSLTVKATLIFILLDFSLTVKAATLIFISG